MEILPLFILLALVTGVGGLAAFFWSVRHDQFEDMDEAASRLFNRPDDDEEEP